MLVICSLRNFLGEKKRYDVGLELVKTSVLLLFNVVSVVLPGSSLAVVLFLCCFCF